MKLVGLLVLGLTLVSNAHAIFDESRLERDWPSSIGTIEGIVATGLADVTDYQIGDEWGKKPATRTTLRGLSPAFIRASLATASFGGGTAFYLGKFNGHHMMATNHHVMPDGRMCGSRSAAFPLLRKSFRCEKFYGDWTAIDLALFSITVPSREDEELLARVGRNFNFRVTLQPGQDLITAGFGSFNNPRRQLMVNEDRDCKVFSSRADYRFIDDPDRINPADYKAWSFATGCDVSHGDSGSAMVDRQTGDVVGIIWTTATQKPERIRNSSYLDDTLRKQGPDVWGWLSYAVPAPKIGEFLVQVLSSGSFPDVDIPTTIRAVLGSPGVRQNLILN